MGRADPPGGRGVRYALTAGPGDVGRRVVVRRAFDDGQLGDLLGELLRWDEAVVVVRDAAGISHTVARGDVVAAKPVPPRPVRHPGAADPPAS